MIQLGTYLNDVKARILSPVSILFAELPVAWLNGEPGWNWEDEHNNYTNDEANGNHV